MPAVLLHDGRVIRLIDKYKHKLQKIIIWLLYLFW